MVVFGGALLHNNTPTPLLNLKGRGAACHRKNTACMSQNRGVIENNGGKNCEETSSVFLMLQNMQMDER